MVADSFSLGFVIGIALCILGHAGFELAGYIAERGRRVQRARLNAQRLEQQRFFTQWPERSL